MFDIGWTELLVIGIVALIVVGPRDLPGMFRQLGKFTARMRAMARDFQRAMDAAADEAGVKDVAADLKKASNPTKMGLDAVRDAAKDLTDIKEPPKPKPAAERGGETAKLSEERAEAARKIHDYSAKKAAEKRATETAAKAPEVADAAAEAEPPKSDNA